MSSADHDSGRTTGGGGTLAGRICAAPLPEESDSPGQRFQSWLGEIDASAAAAIRSHCDANDAVGRLLAGLFDGSPYLRELCERDPGGLADLLASDPDQRIREVLERIQSKCDAVAEDGEVMRVLRRGKAEAALLIALADIGGVWPVMTVTRALTNLADTTVKAAVRHLLRSIVQRGRLKPADPTQPELGSGYVVLAMGKMGAFELNYSSDIDLIVFFDPSAAALTGDFEPGSIFIRLTRGLVKLMQERTADGYVFRVDLRLRPDPSATQIAISTPAALDYYESRGQNWERAAMIKARVCAGDPQTGAMILKNLAPFVWRRYLDYAAVADVHAMKRQINAYRGHGEIAVEGHNIKLGRGGIREIEFFVQTQQLIAGGRHPELRGRDTLATLVTLAEGGWIGEAACHDLDDAYRFLRQVEHRLQMLRDEQTHTLPEDRGAMQQFARFLGYENRDAFAQALTGHLRKVQQHYSQLFEQGPGKGPDEPDLRFPADHDDKETLDRLTGMGFRRALEISVSIRGWLAGEHRTLRSEATRQQLADLLPILLERLARNENPDAAFVALDRFLGALHGGGRLLALLRQNPDLVGLMTLILGTAPRLADILANHPHVMDALIEPTFFGALPDEETLNAELQRSLAEAQSYEDLLDRIRIFGQEHMFLIGVRILSGTASAEQAGGVFARLADVLIRAVHGAVEQEFAGTYGRVAGQQTALVAMGKLGSREMTASSDLDLILIYDFDAEQPESDGRRPLYGAQYFARLTQRLISALTAQTNFGKLYDVDMRLRPSGRAGPLATKIDSFADYQDTEAWTWEHMALTRARVVSGSPGFAGRIAGVIDGVLRRPRDANSVAADVLEMRQAIAVERGESDPWNLKYAAGGLIDLEFIAQYLQLVYGAEVPEILDPSTIRVLDRAWQAGLLATDHAEILRPAARLYQDLTQVLRLCLGGPFDPKAAGPGLIGLVTRAADVPDFATLEAHLVETQTRVRASFMALLGAGS